MGPNNTPEKRALLHERSFHITCSTVNGVEQPVDRAGFTLLRCRRALSRAIEPAMQVDLLAVDMGVEATGPPEPSEPGASEPLIDSVTTSDGCDITYEVHGLDVGAG